MIHVSNMKFVLVLVLLLVILNAEAQKVVSSPDNNLHVTVTYGKTLRLSAQYKNTQIIKSSDIGLDIDNISENWSNAKTSIVSRRDSIIAPVPEKRRVIKDHYNELTIDFKNIALQVRAYNDGFAYRFTSSLKDSVTIRTEIASYELPPNTTFYGSPVNKRNEVDIYHTSFEEPYLIKPTDSITAERLFFSPVLLALNNGTKLVITESDLEDYPGTFLRFSRRNVVEGVNAPFPLKVKMTTDNFPQELVIQRSDYIARTVGKRTYPWRAFLVSEKDKDLPSNDLVYRLGAPSRVKDPSWIKPGKGTDEWIIGINLFNVPFKSGLNTATYKFYIDFAKQFGFQRIMMDAGWSDYTDLFKINPDLDIDEIARYAKSQGIELSMWTLASTLDRQLEPALAQFKKWGVSFIMTDFMDRDDQKMVNFYHRVAKACAEQKIMVMYHGAFKPAGFTRTWPNAITREGVLGSEYNIWSNKPTPDHDLLLPFIRMTAGPMDYEPGILDNATQKTFRSIEEKVMSMGTRMHQAAMFIVYESPIQLFSGNPSQGLLEPDFMNIIGTIPTVWDETVVLDGKLGEYIVTARIKDGSWYIGGMTNWEERKIDIDFSFLDNDVYSATLGFDGINANRYASDYTLEKRDIKKSDKMSISMAKGGGFVIVLTRKK
jgi:alpha-glucosidase